MYWAEAMATQQDDADLAAKFAPAAEALAANEDKIIAELNGAQGQAVEVGGYYNPDDAMATQAMRPSEMFNGIIDAL